MKKLIYSYLKLKGLHLGGRRSGTDNFPFEGGVWPLEEMNFDRCNLDKPVMDKYSRYMDWESVRYLEFGTADYLSFFRTLEKRLPNLRSYKLGPHFGVTELNFYPCLNQFLTRVGPLKELVIDSYNSDGALELPTIVKHRATLRSLNYHGQELHGMRLRRDTLQSAEDFRIINKACPYLKSFSLDFDLNGEDVGVSNAPAIAQYFVETSSQPSDVHGALARFPRLRHLTLAMDMLGITRVNIDL